MFDPHVDILVLLCRVLGFYPFKVVFHVFTWPTFGGVHLSLFNLSHWQRGFLANNLVFLGPSSLCIYALDRFLLAYFFFTVVFSFSFFSARGFLVRKAIVSSRWRNSLSFREGVQLAMSDKIKHD